MSGGITSKGETPTIRDRMDNFCRSRPQGCGQVCEPPGRFWAPGVPIHRFDDTGAFLVIFVALENDMRFLKCGPTPNVKIWDGVTLVFNRENQNQSLSPPTNLLQRFIQIQGSGTEHVAEVQG